MTDLNIVVAGASGRMGRALVREISQGQGVTLVGALEVEGHPDLGMDAGTLAAQRYDALDTHVSICEQQRTDIVARRANAGQMRRCLMPFLMNSLDRFQGTVLRGTARTESNRKKFRF